MIDARRPRRWFPVVLACGMPLSGCAAEPDAAVTGRAEMPTSEMSADFAPPQAPPIPGEAPADRAAAAAAPGESAPPPAMPRKIIYNGRVELVVPDLDAAASRLLELISAEGGYVSETDVSGSPGSQRRGSWKLRVPAERFADLMAAIGRLGELTQTRTDSQDVSQEYYDLEARISVKQQEEERLLAILDEAAGKLKDILEVERELARVRSEVEQMQGRLRWLAHNTALSTITVNLTEIRNYVAPAAPTFVERIARRFQGSIERVGLFLEWAVLAAVGLVPWLVVILPVGLAAWLVIRRRRPFGAARTSA